MSPRGRRRIGRAGAPELEPRCSQLSGRDSDDAGRRGRGRSGQPPGAGPGMPTGSRQAGITRPRRSRATSCPSRPSTGCSSPASSPRRLAAGTFSTVNPATEEPLAESRRQARPMSTGRSQLPGQPTTRCWGPMPGAERAKYLYRIARVAAGAGPRVCRAGEPRQRQADPGVAGRRHPAGRGALLLLRGLGGQARARRVRPGAAAAGRGRPGHPLELPADDGRMEARAGAGRRQHLRAQAGRDDAADRAAAGRGRATRPGCRPAWSTC